MNMNIPDWAESALTKPSAFDQAELTILREFYTAWESLHANARQPMKKHKAEEAAVKMVEAAKVLRAMKHPNNPSPMLSGVKINGH